MPDSAEGLRQRIAYYRRRLAEGTSGEMAQMYLVQIAKDRAALRALGEAARPARPTPSKE